MADPIRIANCSGFYGDRLDAAREMVEGGPIDVLTGDWLAELTMLILAKSRRRPGGVGYARTFLAQMEGVMGTCLDRGIRVVSNAGGLDPAGCAEALHELADRLGLAPTIAYVDGDDLLDRIGELVASGRARPMGGDAGDPSRYLTANAYLGCWGIVAALAGGADIVVTGRVTDAALVCGPAAWHHGWTPDDLDPLAGAVVAGHVVECGAQATGGNYSFFTEIDGYDGAGARLGFPWAEVAEDGSAIIGKHDGTGGLVDRGTVVSQLLYEIEGARYLGPDVVARFDTIEVTDLGGDRVRLSGVRGEPPPATLKVGVAEHGGYRNTVEVALTGLDVEEKARFARAAFWRVNPHEPSDYDLVDDRVLRTDLPDPPTNEQATAVWRLVVADRDEAKVGRAFVGALVETALASIPGLYLLSGPPRGATAFGVHRALAVDAELVRQRVHFPDGRVVEAPAGGRPEAASRLDVPATEPPAPVGGSTRPVPLGRVAGTRSGDKGADANLGVYVRREEAWAWLRGFLTVDALRALLPEIAPHPIERHEFPNLWGLNFVIRGLLAPGASGSPRRDPQAKSLGEWLRARVVEVPVALLDDPGGRGSQP